VTRDLLITLVYVCVQVEAAARGVNRDRAWQQEQLPRCGLHTGSPVQLESPCRRHHERGAVPHSCLHACSQVAAQRRGIESLQQ
jgi:hypothetical protein